MRCTFHRVILPEVGWSDGHPQRQMQFDQLRHRKAGQQRWLIGWNKQIDARAEEVDGACLPLPLGGCCITFA